MGRKRSRKSNLATRPEGSESHPAEEKQTQCSCPYNSEKPPISDENEKTAVYETLRNEIISTQAMRTNLIVYMFSVYFLLFGYGIGNGESHKLRFVATYAVLLAFQTKIIRLKFTIARISAFISKYFEEEKEDRLYKWETINLYNDFFRTNNKLFTILSSTAAFQLGLLSLFAFLRYTYKEYGNMNILLWSCPDKFSVGICFISLFFLLRIRDEYKVSIEIKKSMKQQFETAVITEETETDSNGSL